jgi:hypothetical protein
MSEMPEEFREMSLRDRGLIYEEIKRILNRHKTSVRPVLNNPAKFDKVAPELEKALDFSKDEIKGILEHIQLALELSERGETDLDRVRFHSARLPSLDQIESRRDPDVQYEARYGIWRSE